uniref:Uncharacterized protein n=1 Tax=Glossina pallidipes TaxID=7398 RepID=A0A1A9ZW24_GLOPL
MVTKVPQFGRRKTLRALCGENGDLRRNQIGTQQTKHPITSFRLIITTVTNPFVLQNHKNTSTSMAGRTSTSTPPTTNIVAAVRTTADQAALQPQQHVVLPQTGVLAPNAATPTSSLQITPTTPTLSIPQQIDHTFTNPTATTSPAAMTSVPAQAPGMAVSINLTVCSPATIAALLSQLTGSLTLTVSEQREQLTLQHGHTQPPVEQPRPIRRTVVTGIITSVTINDEPARAEGTNEVAPQLPTSGELWSYPGGQPPNADPTTTQQWSSRTARAPGVRPARRATQAPDNKPTAKGPGQCAGATGPNGRGAQERRRPRPADGNHYR